MNSIKIPTLIVNGNNDVGSVEHAAGMYRVIPGSQMAVLPGRHGAYIGAAEYLDNERWTQ